MENIIENIIVAEVSRNWVNGVTVRPGTISTDFAAVINHNAQRGYALHSFQLHRLMVEPGQMNETIIAVFERVIRLGPEGFLRVVDEQGS